MFGCNLLRRNQYYNNGVRRCFRWKKTRPAQVRNRARFKSNLLRNHFKGGRNRQIRRIAQQLGYPVIHLHRAIGSIQLQPSGEAPLPKGRYRPLRDSELRFYKTKSTSQPFRSQLPSRSRKHMKWYRKKNKRESIGELEQQRIEKL